MVSIPMLARAVAVILLGGALVMVVRDAGQKAADAPAAAAPVQSADPLRERLAHCRQLGAAAADDPACTAAWAENRRRFFRKDIGPRAPTPAPAIPGEEAR